MSGLAAPFDWDPVKAAADRAKRGIDVADAMTVLRDPLARADARGIAARDLVNTMRKKDIEPIGAVA